MINNVPMMAQKGHLYCPRTSETNSWKAVAVRFQITNLGRSLQTEATQYLINVCVIIICTIVHVSCIFVCVCLFELSYLFV